MKKKNTTKTTKRYTVLGEDVKKVLTKYNKRKRYTVLGEKINY